MPDSPNPNWDEYLDKMVEVKKYPSNPEKAEIKK
jgi:hypothetical protein